MTIFHKIINKEIPANIVYEDEDILVILDLYPMTYGHSLVLPKKYSKHLLEMKSEDIAILFAKTKEIADKLVSKLGASGCNIVTNVNESSGQSIPYTHIHIVPSYDSDYYIFNKETEVINVDFNELLEKVKF